jgi:hypothetical protein
MSKIATSIALLSLLGLTACFKGDRATTTDAANDAAGTGDNDLARRVSGVWLLSTDYNYDERCNYLPEEFIRSLYKVKESAEMTKFDLKDGCEVRWEGQKVGFYFQESSPFESTFQSEYVFDKFFQPQRLAATSSIDAQSDSKNESYHGPNTEGTGAERPADGIAAGGGGGTDSSAVNDTSNQPDPNLTSATLRLAAPAENTATGVAINGLGDKAIWEPGKKTLHVLHLNHIFHIRSQVKGDDKVAQQGSISLAKVLMDKLYSVNGGQSPVR